MTNNSHTGSQTTPMNLIELIKFLEKQNNHKDAFSYIVRVLFNMLLHTLKYTFLAWSAFTFGIPISI